jgi:hypothetical protein
MIQIINMSPPGKAKPGAKGKGKTLTSRKTRKTVIHPTEKKSEKKKMTNTEKKKPIQKKQPTKKGSEKKPTRKQRTPSLKVSSPEHCVVVFVNGKTQYFITEDQARIAYQGLPIGVVKEYKMFETVGKATSFIQTQEKGKQTVISVKKPVPTTQKKTRSTGKKIIDASIPVTPDNMTTKMQTLKAMCLKSGPYKPAATTSPSSTNRMTTGNESLLQSIERRAHCMNNKLRVFVCKFETEDEEIPANYEFPEEQVIVIDMHEESKNATFWTHKPRKWVSLFEEAKRINSTTFDDECYKLKAFQFRDVTSGMKNEGKMFHYKTTRGTEMHLPVDGLFAMVPFIWTTENILDFVVKIGRNMLRDIAKQGYKAMFPNAAGNFSEHIGTDEKKALYWKTLEAVFEKQNISVIKTEALAETLGDDAIYTVMEQLFDETRPMSEWTDPLRVMYAYKNLLDATG